VSFHGLLDIETLGGAGFASQRTVGDDRRWDLAPFAGVEVSIDALLSDHKVYTLILKDQLLPRNPLNGREQSTPSWEYDFSKSDCHHETSTASSSSFSATLFVPWDRFKPNYRGKPRHDTGELDLGNIKRISIMIRSFFGSQQGPFNLYIESIAARTPPPSAEMSTSHAYRGSGLTHVATVDIGSEETSTA
jgi:hypothetical protein